MNFRISTIRNNRNYYCFINANFAFSTLFPPYGQNDPKIDLNSSCPLQLPTKVEHVIGKASQKKVDLVGKKPHVPSPFPLEMQRKYPKHPLHFRPDSRKDPVAPLLPRTQRTISPCLGQYSVKLAFLATLFFERVLVVGLVGKYGLLIAFEKLIEYLGIVDVGRCADKLGDEPRLWVHGNMVLVAVNRLFALFGEGGIIVFSWTSGGLDQAGVDDLSGTEFKAFLGEAFAVKVHGFEI